MAFRVLSLDGGGVWAVVQALALIKLYDEKTTGRTVLQDFDLVVATSAGSIVLGGLLEDYPLGEVLEIFADEKSRKAMFSPTSDWFGPTLNWAAGVGDKYSTAKKLEALQTLTPRFGCRPLAAATAGLRRPGAERDLHVLMTAFDYDRNRAQFFRSAPARGWAWGEGDVAPVTLAEAINASADPPINYFDKPATVGKSRYWDGAIAGYDNPVLAGISEARVLTNGSADIIALSIGAGHVYLAGPPAAHPRSPYVQKKTLQCLKNDISKIAVSIVDDPPDAATFLAHVMTGGVSGLPYPLQSRIVRMSPLVRPVRVDGKWTAPAGMTDAQFDYLAGLGIDAIEQEEVAAIQKFAGFWIAGLAPNQPIRMNGDTLACELGHELFSEAAADWRRLCAATDPRAPRPMSRGTAEMRGAASPEAYAFYLAAREHWDAGASDSRALERVVRLCESAIAIDPRFPHAWALKSLAQGALVHVCGRAGDDGADALQRALEIDPDLAEAHALRARALYRAGRHEEAFAALEAALDLDPESYDVNSQAGAILYGEGRFEDAAGRLRKCLALNDTDFGSARTLASALEALGDVTGSRRAAAEAEARALKVLGRDRHNSHAMSQSVLAMAALGDHERARAGVGRAALLEPDDVIARYNLARALGAHLDDVAGAFDLLGPVLAIAGADLVRHARRDPALGRIRRDPRFESLVAQAEIRLGMRTPSPK